MSYIKFYLKIILISFIIDYPFYSQNPEWINYTTGDRVFDILDNGEYLWLGTRGGLYKLNKSTEDITCINRANAGIPDNHILSLAIDSANNLWMGSEYYGIGKLVGSKCTVFNTENSGLPIDQWNTKIKIDNKGKIWIGSLRYLSIFDGSNWKTYKTGSPVSSYTAINDIFFDKIGNTWIGASWGLGKFINDSLIENFEGFNKEIRVIRSDTANSLWLGTLNGGLFKYDGISWATYDTTNSQIPSNIIYDMEFDKTGSLWIASNKGLIKFDGSNWIIYDTTNSRLLENNIFSIEVDKSSVLWIGLFDHGLMSFDGVNWKSYKLGDNALPTNFIYALDIDKSNNIWIGTNKGLVKFFNNKWVFFDKDNLGLKYDYILSLNSSQNEDLWIGARGYNCLTKFDGTNWTVFDSTNSILKEEMVEAIKEDSDGNIWLATWRGIVKYDGTSWSRYDNTNTPIKSNIITDILFDSKGNLWVASITYPFVQGWDGGLAKFTGSEWTTYSRNNSGLPSDSVSCLTIDSEDNLWVGTGNGLAKFDGNINWKVYNIGNTDLPTNSILNIHIKNKDTLWIGTGYGLSRFINEKEWTNFDVTNSGLAHNYVWAIDEDKNGNIWIAHNTPGGISVFREGGVILTNTRKDKLNYLPTDFFLYQNYPNPFNPTTKIKYKIPVPSNLSKRETLVRLKIYDILGRVVSTILNEEQKAGTYEVEFDGSNLSSGIYFYRLQIGKYSSTKKFILLR